MSVLTTEAMSAAETSCHMVSVETGQMSAVETRVTRQMMKSRIIGLALRGKGLGHSHLVKPYMCHNQRLPPSAYAGSSSHLC